jgi:hypothetical protein
VALLPEEVTNAGGRALSQSLYVSRDRSSISGTFKVRGPAILEESQDAPLTVILSPPPGQVTKKVTVRAPGALRVLTDNGAPSKALDIEVLEGGNGILYVKAGNTPIASDSVKYAYPSTVAVYIPSVGDTVVVALCIRRSVTSVLRSIVASSSAVMKLLTGSAVVVAIGGLLAFALVDDDVPKITGGVIAVGVLVAFSLWFIISTMSRGARIREVINQNLSSEGVA